MFERLINNRHLRRLFISLAGLLSSIAWSETRDEDALLREFERLRMGIFVSQEQSQREIDALFASLDPEKTPKAYLAGYTLAGIEVKKRLKAPSFTEELARAQALQDPHLLASLYLSEARDSRENNPDATLGYLATAEAVAKTAGDQLLRGLVLEETAFTHYVFYNRQESIKTIEAALEVLKDKQDHPFYLTSRSTLALILFSTNRKEESIRISSETFEHFKALQFFSAASVEASNTATSLGDMEPPDVTRAGHYFDEAIHLARRSQDGSAMATALSGIGRLYYRRSPEKAIPSLVKAVALFHERGDKLYETDAGLLLAEAYINKRDSVSGAEVLETIARIPESTSYHAEKILLLRSRLAELKRDYREALKLFQDFHSNREDRKKNEEDAELNKLSTSLNLRIEEEKNKNLQIELVQKEQARELLDAQNRSQRLQLEKSERERQLLIAGLGLVLIVAAAMLWGLWQGLQIRRQKQLLQEIMDSVHEGIVRFGMDRRLQAPYSRHLEAILGHDQLLGQPVVDILLPEDKAGREALNAYLDAILGENQLSWDLNGVHLPAEIRYASRTLQLYWHPVQGLGGIIQGLLLVLRDITEHKNYEAILEAERAGMARRNERAMELQQADLVRTQRYLHNVHAWLEDHPEQRAQRDMLLRRLHTWKGEARTLGLKQLAMAFHGSEQLLIDEQGGTIGDRLAECKRLLLEYQSLLDEMVMPEVTTAHHNLLALSQDLFADARDRIREAGLRWGKLQVNDAVEHWDEAVVELVREILVHGIANSVDHGYLRSSPDFQARARVSLTLSAWEHAGILHLRLSDGGQGIDWERVQVLARKHGITSSAKEDMIRVIFKDGTSTADQVSISSGRGVGLAAIQSLCSEYCGVVRFADDEGRGGTCLDVEIPVPLTKAYGSRAG